MSKTLNLSDIEEEALIKMLRRHESGASKYVTGYKLSRATALVVIRSMLKKLGETPTDREVD